MKNSHLNSTLEMEENMKLRKSLIGIFFLLLITSVPLVFPQNQEAIPLDVTKHSERLISIDVLGEANIVALNSERVPYLASWILSKVPKRRMTEKSPLSPFSRRRLVNQISRRRSKRFGK